MPTRLRASVRKPSTEYLPATDDHPELEIVRSPRRTKTVSGSFTPEGRVRLLVPVQTTDDDIWEYLEHLLPRIIRQKETQDARKRTFVSNDYLVQRAQNLIAQYLPEVELPQEIRWVTNQSTRWGSATPATSRIRLSHLLQGAPEYVIDYVLHHELCHFVYLNHSAAFRGLEARYPRTAEARAFLEGLSFGQQKNASAR
ncbi:M48 family metallopeptidase [Rothia sp. ZJ932]|uniref:M48 metallopeptidase family protein n=1 Tax=Rothia sp. ZJ932 TaxID=2810516 RepID=UPI001F0728BC|nr:M48 family metallopeptidase [Rothia sp. ZJ932]